MEQLRCDLSKPYASDEMCFPIEGKSNSQFTIEAIFGRPIRGACPVSQVNEGQVHLKLMPSMQIETSPTSMSNGQAHYILTGSPLLIPPNVDEPFDIHVSFEEGRTLPAPPSPPLTVSRWLTGHGQERGGLQVLLKNTSPEPLEIVYLESLPWFMKPYLHTLRASVNNTALPLHTIRYRPAIDRLRGTQLEVQLVIPALQTVSISMEFDKSILRYTEYPPDANRGFDVPYVLQHVTLIRSPAVITVLGGGVLRTPALLLSLPTPDFSMPYNVIILSSTVIALAFGSIFNLLVRRFVALEPGDVVVGNKLRGLVLRLIAIIRNRVQSMKSKPTDGMDKQLDNTVEGKTDEKNN